MKGQPGLLESDLQVNALMYKYFESSNSQTLVGVTSAAVL